MFYVFNTQPITDVRKRPVSSIEEYVSTYIVLQPYPFPLKNSPKRLGNVQMRRVWREKEDEETSLFPNRPEFLNPSVAMDGCIVKRHKGVLGDAERKIVKETDNPVCRHWLCGGEPFILVVTGYYPEDVEPCDPLGRNEHVLPSQLPPVWHIAFRTGMALIGLVERDEAVFCLMFKFLQLLNLVLVELRRGCSPWAFPYTLISCANADKKRLKVISLASLPVACSHAALALLTHCLSCSMARRTASSSEESIMGFLPRPGRVLRPSMPSAVYRFTDALTDTGLISVCTPAFAAERPSAFKRTARNAYGSNASRPSEILSRVRDVAFRLTLTLLVFP